VTVPRQFVFIIINLRFLCVACNEHGNKNPLDLSKRGEKTRRHLIYCARRNSGITFIRYARRRKIGKPNKVLVAIKPKCLNRIG